MLYDIEVTLKQIYEDTASGGRHVVRLLPMEIYGVQNLKTGSIEISPEPNELFNRYDFYGNAMSDIAYHGAHPKVEVCLKARVERYVTQSPIDMSPPLSMIKSSLREIRELSSHSPHVFCGPSPRVALVPRIADYARDLVHDAMSLYQVLETVGLALNRDMVFDPEATTVDTPLDQAFDFRKGVCQDFTHIMISALRSLKIPAGYVSGYLRTIPPEGQTERLEGADAMHAWVRAWCGKDMGWIEYDPTNAMFVNMDHVVVAYGRDYSDVAPIRGVLRTSGEQTTDQAVDVRPLET